MPSTFSVEGKIEITLRELGCPGKTFVEIAKMLGVQVSTGGFSEALSDKKAFDHETGERLLDVLDRMAVLQSSVRVPIRWSETEQVSDALALRLISKIDKELHISDAGIERATGEAMRRIGAQS